MNLGKRIRLVRIAKELSQEELADLIGKTRPLISHIEQTGRINHFTLQHFCDVMGVDVEALLDAREPEVPYQIGASSIREMERMQEEIDILTALVDGQKEIIIDLREKLAVYRRKDRKRRR